ALHRERGQAWYPGPGPREPSIRHLATSDQMSSLLIGAGFKVLDVQDSTDESQRYFESLMAQISKAGSLPIGRRPCLRDDFPAVTGDQGRNVPERRIRTVSYICAA